MKFSFLWMLPVITFLTWMTPVAFAQQDEEFLFKDLSKPSLSMGRQFHLVMPNVRSEPTPFPDKIWIPTIDFFFYTLAERLRIEFTFRKMKPPKSNLVNKTAVLSYRKMVIASRSSMGRFTYVCHEVHQPCYYLYYDQRVWTYRFDAPEPFGMHVMVISEYSLAGFSPLPVEAWGREYFAVTLDQQHFMAIMVGDVELTTVTITFKFERTFEHITHAGHTQRHNEVAHVFAERNRAYIIHNCNDATAKPIGHITGTHLVALEPFGLISGNCQSATKTFDCIRNNINFYDYATKDMAVEMLMPSASFGRHFLVFPPLGRIAEGYFFVTAAENLTTVNLITRFLPEPQSTYLLNSSDTKSYFLTDLFHLTSDKGIQVVIVQRSGCFSKSTAHEVKADPSLCLMIPLGLLYHSYSWRTDPTSANQTYVAVMVQQNYRDFLEFVSVPVPENIRWLNITLPSYVVWNFAQFEMRAHPSLQHGISSSQSTFGVYVYGYGLNSGYMHPLGYIVSPINRPCQANVTNRSAGDLLDNDCDGYVDEEIYDGIDNDNDTRIDEDTNTFKLLAYYGPWSEWACTEDCFAHQQFRFRECSGNHPNAYCKGENNQTRTAVCWTEHICPKLCPEHEWGVGCQFKCENCFTDCHKFTGECTQCLPGFKDPKNSCNKTCEEFTFGQDCKGHCRAKCNGKDCLERVVGLCPEEKVPANVTIAGDEQDFGQWEEWTCAKLCTNPKMHRKRHCTSSQPAIHCHGLREEWRAGTCYVNEICPMYCPHGEWGLDCLQTCGNCLGDCNKYDGSCERCRPGFTGTTSGCRTPCGPNTYGSGCTGNCKEKCGSDCLDRTTGECSIYGSYDDWQEWHCSRDCSKTHFERERVCYSPYDEQPDIPCRGDSRETKTGDCYTSHKKCPTSCPQRKWGPGCTKTCDKCFGDCDKFNGTCDRCKPGYRLPNKGCFHPCDKNRYGQDCKGDCLEKCGGMDCIERVNGNCKPENGNKYLIFLILLPVPVIVYFLMPPNGQGTE
ncbi:hypothetical protein Btru_014740 [Bulinus truncatus]|nr:hypothetical protein Btru_014740 [Bulinus truncatus]